MILYFSYNNSEKIVNKHKVNINSFKISPKFKFGLGFYDWY